MCLAHRSLRSPILAKEVDGNGGPDGQRRLEGHDSVRHGRRAMKARSARLVRARVPFAGKGTLVHPLEEGAFLHGRPSSFEG